MDQALARLDALAGGAEFLLGCNLIKFDLPRLPAAMSDISNKYRPTAKG